MDEKRLKQLLQEMLTTKNPDYQISSEQYEYYMAELNNMKHGNEQEVIREILYELDFTEYEFMARRTVYDFRFNRENRDKVLEARNSPTGWWCAGCEKTHAFQEVKDEDITLDHEPPLAERFNAGDWKKDKDQREKSFNENVQLMCRSANSKKGSKNKSGKKVTYDKEKLFKFWFREYI